MPNQIKTIFIGTPDFALPSLKALINDPYFAVSAIITQPDKPFGRKQILTPPPVKTEALRHNLSVYQPEKIKNFQLSTFNFQLIVVVAYSQLIPKALLTVPEYGVINVHGSLLPKYRGAACVQWPLINDEKETGITIMKMDEGLDTGPILKQKTLAIQDDDTAGSLSGKLSLLGAEILLPAIKDYIAGKITPQPQDNSQASYVRQIKNTDARIDWNQRADYLERFVRGMQPWPGAWSQLTINDSRLRIKFFKTYTDDCADEKKVIGEIFSDDNRLCIRCLDGILVIDELQIEGKKRQSGKEFLHGYKEVIGTILN